MSDKSAELNKRPPVVVVLGHVDHGKTSLLDYIRKTRVVSREAGSITQSVGAYEITHNNERITFIDTPGHEAFSAMRRRGANIADIAVLVVSADEGPKPQTEESIKLLKETSTPYIVAITKTDSPRADVEKVKADLMNKEVYLEGFGGDISWQGVSSKTGEGLPELLDLILFLADVSEFTWTMGMAEGFVVESKKDSRKGMIATLILKKGVLNQGDYIATASASGKIRSLEDFSGKAVKSLIPSSPAVVSGFDSLPMVGEEFFGGDESVLKKMKEKVKTFPKRVKLSVEEKRMIPVILKSDVSGTLEVLRDMFEEKVRVLNASAGEITDGDIKEAVAGEAIIVAFRTKLAGKAIETFAKTQNVKVFSSDVIYELSKDVDEYIDKTVVALAAGRMEVLAIFGKREGDKQVIGGRVEEGSIRIGKKIEIKRRGRNLGEGKIINLQQDKNDAKEVETGKECGMLIESQIVVKTGDEISQTATK